MSRKEEKELEIIFTFSCFFMPLLMAVKANPEEPEER